MAVLTRAVRWFLGTYPGRLIQAYASSQAGNYASGLAFTAFVSMFPLMLGLLAVVGFAIGDPGTELRFEVALLSFFPGDAGGALHSTLSGIHRYAGLFGAVGVIGLFWSGSSLFTGMEWALGRMVGARQRDFLRQRAMCLVMTVAFALVVICVVGINAALALAGGAALLGAVAGAVVWTAFMLGVYRAVPNRTHRVTQAWRGAVVAGVLMELLTLLWSLYSRLAGNFNSYGKAFSLFFLLAAWLYFWAQFTLLGAVINRMHAGEPQAAGLVASREPDRLVTEATRAADRYGRRQLQAST
ncbi:MAG TPA: YihY/virulence factor BrkB family protein [Candidatus Dormibacteraeota bacterium]|nr:YihY/virulence factor BrkB family protein [Candidatus Dormibacteraeota bacterium]